MEALEVVKEGPARKALAAFIEQRIDRHRVALDQIVKAQGPVLPPLAQRRWVGWLKPPTPALSPFLTATVAPSHANFGGMRYLERLCQAISENIPDLSGDSAKHRMDLAVRISAAVLGGLGVPLPPVTWLPGSQEAYSKDGRIFMGEELAKSLDARTLSQIVAHEAGHIYEGHTGPVNAVLQALFEAKLIPVERYNSLMRDDKRVADMYAALVAWAIGDREAPGMAQWLAGLDHPRTDTHPSSSERMERMHDVLQVFDLVESARFFRDEWPDDDTFAEVPSAGHFDSGNLGTDFFLSAIPGDGREEAPR